MKPVIVSDATGESLLNKLIEKRRKEMEGDLGENADIGSMPIPIPTIQDLLRDVLLHRLSTVRVRDVDAEDILDDEAQAAAQQEDDDPEQGGDINESVQEPAQTNDGELDLDAASNAASGSSDDEASDSGVVKRKNTNTRRSAFWRRWTYLQMRAGFTRKGLRKSKGRLQQSPTSR